MINRYSAPYELDITGPVSGWEAWEKQLLEMLANHQMRISLVGDETAEAAPYERCLSELQIRLTDSKIRFRVDSDVLVLEADKKHISKFINNFPIVSEENAAKGYHIHYDKIGYEAYFEDDSLDIVLTSAPEVEQGDALNSSSRSAASGVGDH